MFHPKESSGRRCSQHRSARSPLANQGVYVTRHTLERLREHHPNIGVRGALALLARATPVEQAFIAPFLGRSAAGVRDQYLVAADRRGVFVVAPGFEGGGFAWVAVTYLRFGQYQQDVAERLLGAA